jgi:hypothetical protein
MSISRRAETFDFDNLDESDLEIDDRHQLFDERDFEPNALSFYRQSILSNAMGDLHHFTTSRPHLETHQILWPKLAGFERSALLSKYLFSPEPLGAGPVRGFFESHLGALLALTQGANRIGAVLDEDDGPRLDVCQVLRFGVEAEKTLQAVGLSQSPDQHIRTINRGTRLQR